MSGRIIAVNQFNFCLDHGNELCYLCDQDYRSLNNESANIHGQLTKKLGPDFEKDNGFSLEERQPINIFAFGVKANTHHRGPRATGSCTDHAKIDCIKCYNWPKFIEAEATGDGFDAVRGRTIRSG